MRVGLHRSGGLASPHPMVRRLFGPIIGPGRSGLRDVWIERFVRDCDGREPQGTATLSLARPSMFRTDAVVTG